MSAPLMASRNAEHLESGGAALAALLLPGMQAHDYVHAAVAQVQRVRVALAAVTNDGRPSCL